MPKKTRAVSRLPLFGQPLPAVSGRLPVLQESSHARFNMLIGERNRKAIESSDGTNVDSGTASEIGYFFALGKKILGYRGDFRLTGDNPGSTVNLQVEYFIRKSGGRIVCSVEELADALADVFTD